MTDDNGPGIGTLIGMGFAEVDARNRAHVKDLRAMREELLKRTQDTLYQKAFKEAAGTVLGGIVDEIKGVEAGTVAQRRLSDPKNDGARNEAYAEAAAEAVNRLSGGKIKMSRISIDRVKNKQNFK